MPGPDDPIVRRRGFILGETEDSYAIWQRGRSEPLETFPMTNEGFDEAETRLGEIVRSARARSPNPPRVLWAALIAGALLWTVVGVLAGTYAFDGLLEGPLSLFIFGADSLGYRLMLASTLAAVAWRLFRPDAGSLVLRDTTPDSLGRLLKATIIAGLVIWVLAGVGERLLRPSAFPGPFLEDPELPASYRVSLVADVLAFRIWVCALVISVLRTWRASPSKHSTT